VNNQDGQLSVETRAEIDRIARFIFDVPPPIALNAIREAEAHWNVELTARQTDLLQWFFLSHDRAAKETRRSRGPGRPAKTRLQHAMFMLWRLCEDAGGAPSVSWQRRRGRKKPRHSATPFVRGAESILRAAPMALCDSSKRQGSIIHAAKQVRDIFGLKGTRPAGRPRKKNIRPV
jgi:hypothetical protein